MFIISEESIKSIKKKQKIKKKLKMSEKLIKSYSYQKNNKGNQHNLYRCVIG